MDTLVNVNLDLFKIIYLSYCSDLFCELTVVTLYGLLFQILLLFVLSV